LPQGERKAISSGRVLTDRLHGAVEGPDAASEGSGLALQRPQARAAFDGSRPRRPWTGRVKPVGLTAPVARGLACGVTDGPYPYYTLIYCTADGAGFPAVSAFPDDQTAIAHARERLARESLDHLVAVVVGRGPEHDFALVGAWACDSRGRLTWDSPRGRTR
jgi:hypothetical protein